MKCVLSSNSRFAIGTSASLSAQASERGSAAHASARVCGRSHAFHTAEQMHSSTTIVETYFDIETKVVLLIVNAAGYEVGLVCGLGAGWGGLDKLRASRRDMLPALRFFVEVLRFRPDAASVPIVVLLLALLGERPRRLANKPQTGNTHVLCRTTTCNN